MITKILSVGNKIELTRTAKAEGIAAAREKERIFISQILDIEDEEQMKISMPMEQGKIVPFPVNARLDACFYTTGGLYQGRIVVTDRYKEGTIFILVVELVNGLKKYQRRQYFRLGCVIDVKYRKITPEEVLQYSENSDMVIGEEDFVDGTALDISGGGIRFVSKENLEKDQEIFISMEITYSNQSKLYGLLGRVIMSYETKNNDGLYEHRIEFTNMQGGVRESLIRYIFEEERRQRQGV